MNLFYALQTETAGGLPVEAADGGLEGGGEGGGDRLETGTKQATNLD